jgi:hypothetical protein
MPTALDHERYTTLLLRAASNVLLPLGLDEATLHDWVVGKAIPVELPGLSLPRRLEEDVSGRWIDLWMPLKSSAN